MWKMLKKFEIIALYSDALIWKYKSGYEIKRLIEIS